jgi:DNA polymerase elongation subunit (family B)
MVSTTDCPENEILDVWDFAEVEFNKRIPLLLEHWNAYENHLYFGTENLFKEVLITREKPKRRSQTTESLKGRKKYYAYLKHYTKNDAGVWYPVSGMHSKGYDWIRSNVSFLCRYIQKNLLTLVLSRKPSGEVYSFINDTCSSVYNGEWDLIDLATPTTLGSNLDSYKSNLPGHARAAMRGTELYGDEFKRGDTVFVVPFLPRRKSTNVIGFYDPIEAQTDYDLPPIDYETVVEKQIWDKITTILGTIGYKRTDIESMMVQDTFDDCF